jgi:predicted transposase YbfD/YdcC
MTLIDCFSFIPDPRQDYKVKYSLTTLLFTTLCAVLCGCQSWLDISDFCDAKQAWLSKYVDLKSGIPSCWTFRRLFILLDPALIEKLLLEITQLLLNNKPSDQIAIDGKQLRGSRRHNAKCLQSISAWCHDNGLVLAQTAVPEGSHESKAIPLLLEHLNLKETTISIDAAGCQPSLAQKIIEKKGNYMLALKKNQPKLYETAMNHIQDQPHLEHLVQDGFDDSHGRSVRRRYFAYDIKSLPLSKSWPGLKTVLAVESICSTKRTPVTSQWRYYLSSHNVDHPKLTSYIRHHWGIENKLHWILDVQLNEDRDQKTERRSAKAFSTLRRIALNIVKVKDQTKKRSTRRKMLMASWSEESLIKLLL